jgi:hypothetical protein
MSWRVVVKAENPDPRALAALEELTGMARGEILLALRREGLTAARDQPEEKARALSASLASLGLNPVVVETSGSRQAASFRVVLTGFRPGSRARLRECLERLSGLPPEQVVVWMSKIPFVLKDNAGHDAARTVRKLVQEAGGLVELRPVDLPPGDLPEKPRPRREEMARPAPAPPAESIAAPPETVPDEPPAAPEDAPPALPGFRTDEPPALRFRAPGRAPEVPPAIPSASELSLVPPAIPPAPPVARVEEPALPEGVRSVYILRCSPGAREEAAGILRDRLELTQGEIDGLLLGGPSRIAATADPDKASELLSLFDRPGITACLAAAEPRGGPPAGSGFKAWLDV